MTSTGIPRSVTVSAVTGPMQATAELRRRLRTDRGETDGGEIADVAAARSEAVEEDLHAVCAREDDPVVLVGGSDGARERSRVGGRDDRDRREGDHFGPALLE